MGKYSDYTAMEPDYHILKEFPGLSREELDKANSFFKPYLFFENVKGGRKVWTSCCHHRGELWSKVFRLETEEGRGVLLSEHNGEVKCPYCHRWVTVKNVKKMGQAKKLEEYIPVLFLHASDDGETLYAQGYWAWKAYAREEQWANAPLYMVTRVFRFRRGEWLAWRDQWCGGDTDKLRRENREWIGEPFTSGGGMMVSYCGYKVIGLEALSESFLRYTGVRQRYEGRDLCDGFVRTLALAALYPEGVEMLLKAGMTRPIEEWVWRRKKNAKTIHWGEKDPRKVFDLNGRELKEFLAGGKDLDVLKIYKALRKDDKRLTIGEVERQAKDMGLFVLQDLAKRLKTLPGLTLGTLTRYFARFASDEAERQAAKAKRNAGMARRQSVVRMWIDYINFARELGYDLTNPVIRTPRDLERKHDEAYQAVVAIREEAQRRENERLAAKERAQVKKREEDARRRAEELNKRYGFESEHYLIRAPKSAAEIVEEGRALCHCVGGYAARHAEGTDTILFLRSKRRPGIPLCTIEMRGSQLVQVHGYSNERKPCPENPKQLPARKLYAEILTPWLAWVAAGSRRNKKGEPITTKKKEEAVA